LVNWESNEQLSLCYCHKGSQSRNDYRGKITEENMIDMYFDYFTYNLSIFEVKIYNLSRSVKIQSISLCNIKVYKNINGKSEILCLKISYQINLYDWLYANYRK